jgi:hypothetical protein
MGFSFFDTKRPAQFYVQNVLISAYGRKLDSMLEQQVSHRTSYLERLAGSWQPIGSDGNLGLGTLRNLSRNNLGPLSPAQLVVLEQLHQQISTRFQRL